MKAIELFNFNIKRSRSMLALYERLRAEEHTHAQVSDLLRAALVFSVGALDAYIHGKISENIVDYIKTCVKKHKTSKLENTKSKTPLENLKERLKGQFSVSALLSACTMARPFVQIRKHFNDYLYKKTFQNAAEIEDALKIISQHHLWKAIAANSSMPEEDLTKRIDSLAKRRNQIVHEGDRETSRKKSGKKRPLNCGEVTEGIDLIETLVHITNRVIDEHLHAFHASTNSRKRKTVVIPLIETEITIKDEE